MFQERSKHVAYKLQSGVISEIGYEIYSNMQRYKSINNICQETKILSYQPKLIAKLPGL
jgi:hypothetical protein